MPGKGRGEERGSERSGHNVEALARRILEQDVERPDETSECSDARALETAEPAERSGLRGDLDEVMSYCSEGRADSDQKTICGEAHATTFPPVGHQSGHTEDRYPYPPNPKSAVIMCLGFLQLIADMSTIAALSKKPDQLPCAIYIVAMVVAIGSGVLAFGLFMKNSISRAHAEGNQVFLSYVHSNMTMIACVGVASAVNLQAAQFLISNLSCLPVTKAPVSTEVVLKLQQLSVLSVFVENVPTLGVLFWIHWRSGEPMCWQMQLSVAFGLLDVLWLTVFGALAMLLPPPASGEGGRARAFSDAGTPCASRSLLKRCWFLQPMILAIIAFVGVYLLFRQGPPEFERSPFWADEFDICDTFNYKWSALQGCGIGSYGHGQLFDDSAKSINCTNGSLVLTDNWEQQKKLNCYDIRRKTKYTSVNYTSVRLLAETSLGPFGKIDIRARADAPSGFWPAANLYPNHDCGQKKSCFAVEGIAKFLSVPGGSDSATSEFSYPQDGKGKKVWMPRATDQFPEGWAKDFHVWTLTWTQERVEILIDDVLVNALDTSADSVGAWRSPGRLVIELNVLTGDQKPLKSIKSASFEIDYVRYYRLKDYAY